jgi:hypothetical protein
LKADLRVWQKENLYGIEEDEDGFKISKCFRTRWEK